MADGFQALAFRRHFTSILSSILTIGLLAGCGKETTDHTHSSADASALTVSDFDLNDTTPMSADDLRTEMADFDAHENDLYSLKGSAALTITRAKKLALLDDSAFVSGCDTVGKFSQDQITAEGDHFSFHFQIDASDCVKKSIQDPTPGPNSVQFDSVSVIIDATFEMTCPGADYSKFNGIRISELMANADPNAIADPKDEASCKKDNKTITRRAKMQLDASISGSVKDAETGARRHIQVNSVVKNADMAASSGPCSFQVQDGTVTVGDCVHFEKSMTSATVDDAKSPSASSTAKQTPFGLRALRLSGENETKIKGIRADRTGAKSRLQDAYLNDGNISVAVNQWRGKVTLNGSATPPWTMSTSDGQTVSGGASSDPSFPDDPESDPTPPQDPYDIPPLNLSPDSSVFFIGQYESGATGTTQVQIDYADHPVILVLTSYDGAKFAVSATPATKIELVILSGYHPLSVTGLPDGTRLLSSTYEPTLSTGDIAAMSARFPYFYAYKDDSEPTYTMVYNNGWTCTDKVEPFQEHNWTSAQEIIQKITGKSVASAQGQYTGDLFVVDATKLGAPLNAEREAGRCYKNPDGTITPYGMPLD